MGVDDFEATKSDPTWYWNVEMEIAIDVTSDTGPAKLVIFQPSAQVGTSTVRGAFLHGDNHINFTFDCTSEGFKRMLRGLEHVFDEYSEREPHNVCKHGSTSIYGTCEECSDKAAGL